MMKLGNLELPSNPQKSLSKDFFFRLFCVVRTDSVFFSVTLFCVVRTDTAWRVAVGRQQSIADVRSSTNKKINAWPQNLHRGNTIHLNLLCEKLRERRASFSIQYLRHYFPEVNKFWCTVATLLVRSFGIALRAITIVRPETLTKKLKLTLANSSLLSGFCH